MLRFRSGDLVPPASLDTEESSNDVEVANIKQKLLTDLRAYESVIFYFQQLLVWEKPAHSVVFVLLLHAGFWYLKVWSAHAIGLIASVLLLAVWLDMWKHRIWPEIRAREPDPEASEWGELHPRLLSLPEICQTLAEYLVVVKSYHAIIWDFRTHSPGKFVAATVATCFLAIFVGRSIPGTLLAYIIMVCCLMWPLMWYRRWVERVYSCMEPFFMQLQYSLKPRMRRNGKKGTHITKEIDGTSVEVHTDSSSDEDISEFTKPLDAVTAEVLARALTDDDELSESDESLLAHELPSFPRPSSKDGDKGAHMLAEVMLPVEPPRYDDPSFAKEMLDDPGLDDNLGVPGSTPGANEMPALARQMITQAATEAMTNVIKDTISKAIGKSDQDAQQEETLSDSSRSTPTDDGFVVLNESDSP